MPTNQLAPPDLPGLFMRSIGVPNGLGPPDLQRPSMQNTPPLAAPPPTDGTMTPADVWSFNRDNLGDAWQAAQNPDTWREAAQNFGDAMLMGSIGPEGKGFTAYHGSPHAFDQFDLSKIGTGEGAQAYGHGMYLADSEGVAKGYRDRLSPSGLQIEQNGQSIGQFPNTHIINDPAFVDAYNKLIPADVPGWIKAAAMRDISGMSQTGQAVDLGAARQASMARLMQEFDGKPMAQQGAADAINKAYDSIGGDISFRAPGHMYEVNVNADPAKFLDWDKPLSEQHPDVQAALKTWNDQRPANQQLPTHVYGQRQPGQPLPDLVEPSGEGIYKHFSSVSGNDPAAAAQALHQAGIPGIRYLDQGSRGSGEGTRNSVVFSPDVMNIIRRYGLAGLLGGGAAAATQQPSQ